MLHLLIPHFRDHLRKSKHRHFKSRKWPIGAVFFFLMEVAVVNMYICMKEVLPKLQNCNVKEELCNQVQEFCRAQNNPRLIGPALERETYDSHVSYRSGELERRRRDICVPHLLKKRAREQRCRMHGADRKRHRTVYYCTACNVGLHPDCHFAFHTANTLP